MIRDLATGDPIVDLEAALLGEDRDSDRPWVMLNIVTSVDGATAVDGGSTPLSDDDDRALFHALRRIADVILVGSGTVMAEDYHPDARLAIVSGRLNLDPAKRVFSDPGQRPTIFSSVAADPARVETLQRVAEVVLLDDLSGAGVVRQFEAGSVVLCEGGPTLNGSLFSDDVVDEINWTVSPLITMGESKRMTAGEALDPPARFRVVRTWSGEQSLFLRYVRA